MSYSFRQKPRYRCYYPAALLLLAALASVTGCVAPADERWRQYNEIGVDEFALAHYGNALESFDLALTFRPQDPVLIYNTAQCYDRLGDVKKAEQYYVHCLSIDPKHGDSRLALVSLLYRTNRVNEAGQKTQEWLTVDPQSADPYVADAWRLRQQRDYPGAQGRLQQALAIDPNSRRAQTELAILYELMGMPDRSYVLYERILEGEPNQIEIAARLAQLKAKGIARPTPN